MTNKLIRVIVAFMAMASVPAVVVAADGYHETVAQWRSHEDVARWLADHFVFDKARQVTVVRRLKSQGPAGLLVRSPEKLFADHTGYCVDSANFALQALNEIDFDYNARWVFIKNAAGDPNHWVTAFDYQGKLYIMDYGAGEKWKVMRGVHGPYDSLAQYQDYLESLNVPGFGVAEVRYRSMPGKED